MKSFLVATVLASTTLASTALADVNLLDVLDRSGIAEADSESASDPALLAALKAPRGSTMRDIVATIRAEQDAIEIQRACAGHHGIGGGAQFVEMLDVALASERGDGAVGGRDLAIGRHRHVDEDERARRAPRGRRREGGAFGRFHRMSMASP